MACCRLHKQRDECSGKRDRTRFAAVKDFDDSQLLSDYRFFEDIAREQFVAQRVAEPLSGGKRVRSVTRHPLDDGRMRTAGAVPGSETQEPAHAAEVGDSKGKEGLVGEPVESAAAERGEAGAASTTSAAASGGERSASQAHSERKVRKFGTPQLPRALQHVELACKKRGIRWTAMPRGMTRRETNKTFYNVKDDLLKWSVAFRCELAALGDDSAATKSGDSTTVDVLVAQQRENSTLRDVWRAAVDQLEQQSALKNDMHGAAAHADHLRFRLVREAASDRYKAVSLDETLASVLVGELVIEYPTFEVSVLS